MTVSPFTLPDDPLDPRTWMPAADDAGWVAATVHTDHGVLVGDVRFDVDRPALVGEELIEVRVAVDVRRYRHHWVPIMDLQEIIETEPRP